MNMKRSILFLIFSFTLAGVWSQQHNCDCSSAEDYGYRLQQGIMGVEYINPVEGYEGDQYLNEWSYGEVDLADGDMITNIFVRYDRYTDQLLWLRMSDYRKGVLNKEDITGFRLIDAMNHLHASFTKMKIKLPFADSTESFLQVMVEGKIGLYIYRNVTTEPVEYKLMDNTRHLIHANGQDYQVTLRRKSLLELPFINKSEMKKVIRRNHVPIKDNEQGLVRAIASYNEMP
jgi:hypothetical protein